MPPPASSASFFFQELLRASGAELRLNTSVTGVVGSAKDGYSIFGGDGGAKLRTFDAVAIATPISLAGIALDVRGEVSKLGPFVLFVRHNQYTRGDQS